MRRLALASILLVLLFVPSAQACIKDKPQAMGDWDSAARFYLESDSATSGPFLADSPDASSSSQFTAAAATAAPTALAGSLQGQKGASAEFASKAPPASVLYLNLSKPVWGTLYWSRPVNAAAGRGEGQYVRVEIFQGGARIGGQDHLLLPSAVRTAWYPFHFCFRPEVRSIDAGTPLTMRVTLLGHYSEFIVGTGGTQQSFVEFRGFETDPLSGGLYIENGQLIRAPSGGAGTEQQDAPWWLLLAGAPLLARGRPRSGRASAILLLLLAGALAGCMGGGGPNQAADPETQAPKPTANVTYEDLPPEPATTGSTPAPSQKGNIEGVVADPTSIPIAEAHVSLLGTSHFGRTNKTGAFRFEDVPANTYTLRVDKTGFDPFEGPITVEAARVARATITLTYPNATTLDDKPHLHDDWGGSTIATMYEKTFRPAWRASTGLSVTFTVDIPTVQLPSDRTEGCPGVYLCESEIRIPSGSYVYPGTGTVEVRLGWAAATGVPKELALRVDTTTNKSANQVFVARGTNDPFRVQIFPQEADYGHQKYTDWRFWIQVPGRDPTHPWGENVHAGFDVTVQIRIHKSVVPFEPAHRDLWGGADEIVLFNEVKRGPGECLNCDFPAIEARSMWSLGTGKFTGPYVPPETAQIVGTLKWTKTGLNGPTAWGLVYRHANVPLAPDQVALYPKVETVREDDGLLEFKIVPKAGEADQYYQVFSKWVFLLDDRDQPAKGVNSGYGTTWTLSAKAVRG